MYRTLSMMLLVCLAIPLHPVAADDSSLSTLEFFFPAVERSSPFKPDIAKLYVDDKYVGDAIVNLSSHIPVLRFPSSTRKIRMEMSDDRRFESTVTFLGNGSMQILVVDFSKAPIEAVTSGHNHSVSATPDDKLVKAVMRIIERYDRNKDEVLDGSEWEKMLMSPADADVDHDGKITVDEYAAWMEARERRKGL